MRNWQNNDINFLALYLCIIYPTCISVERALLAFESKDGLGLETNYTLEQIKWLMSYGRKFHREYPPYR